MVENANALRRTIVGRERLRAYTWWVGLGLLVAAGFLALEAVWAAAVPILVVAAGFLWLAGAWVRPRSRDAYVRRLLRLRDTWAVETKLAYGQFDARQSKFTSRLIALSPPPDYQREHDRLVSLATERDRLRGVRSTSPNWGRDVVQAIQGIRDVHDQISRRAISGEQRAYVEAVDRLLAARRRDYATAAREVERATVEAAGKLACIKPPDLARGEHEELRCAFAAQVDVTRRFHEANESADPDAVAKATADWYASLANIREIFGRLGEQLGFHQRWPLPAAPSTERENK